MPDQPNPQEDFKLPFQRARRAIRHTFHIAQGNMEYNPNECDGCKEIHHFLTDPSYRGDEHYPVGVDGPTSGPEEGLGLNWKLGPDDMEPLPRPRKATIHCEQCDRDQPLVIQQMARDPLSSDTSWRDLACGVCGFILATITVPEAGEYEFVKVCNVAQSA